MLTGVIVFAGFFCFCFHIVKPVMLILQLLPILYVREKSLVGLKTILTNTYQNSLVVEYLTDH